jgi:hypothetical protein
MHPIPAADDYQPGPDSQPQAGPKGEVRTGVFAESRIFPGTTRDYFVYVPKQYDPAKPACLLVCFDGAGIFNAKLDRRQDGVFAKFLCNQLIDGDADIGADGIAACAGTREKHGSARMVAAALAAGDFEAFAAAENRKALAAAR